MTKQPPSRGTDSTLPILKATLRRMPLPEHTADSLFHGSVQCLQPKNGYRFSIDAVLLAHFARPRKKSTVLDLGCGCGVMPLILAYRHQEITITAIELQDNLADLCRENITINRLVARITLIKGDFRQASDLAIAPESFDTVISNPPYRKFSSGRTNPRADVAAARHEITAELGDVLKTAAWAVRNRGKVCLVYPAARTSALFAAMRENRLEPKRLQPVYSYPEDDCRLVLVEAVKNGGEELTILPPFYIYQKKGGDYTAVMQQCFAL